MKTKLDRDDEMLAVIDARNTFERNYEWLVKDRMLVFDFKCSNGPYKGLAGELYREEMNRLIDNDEALPQ